METYSTLLSGMSNRIDRQHKSQRTLLYDLVELDSVVKRKTTYACVYASNGKAQERVLDFLIGHRRADDKAENRDGCSRCDKVTSFPFEVTGEAEGEDENEGAVRKVKIEFRDVRMDE